MRHRVESAFFRENFAPLHLFLAGMALIPAYMFQTSLPVKVLQSALFAVLAVLAGKRLKFFYFASLVVSITLFNLLSPWGKVIFEAGPFKVTRGALEGGLLKGFTITGLVFISLFTIRPDLRIPGRLGGLIAKVFLYFERVLEGKRKVNPRRLIESLDGILTDLYQPGMRTVVPEGPVRRTTPAGVLFILILLLLNYGMLAAGRFLPLP